MKRFILSLLLLFSIGFNSRAQVILLDSDESRERIEVEGTPPFIPTLGVTYDQYAPLSDGTVLLCCIGAAYLLKKKRKMRR